MVTTYLGLSLVLVYLHVNCLECVPDNFGFKQEERFDCGAKAGDVFANQRRFPQPLFWDYKVHIICTDKQFSNSYRINCLSLLSGT